MGMNSIQTYSISKLGTHRGSRRLWLQGTNPARGGFTPGTRYRVDSEPTKTLLTLVAADDGDRRVSRKVSNEREIPIIDINDGELLSLFEGLSSVRVIVEPGKISVLPVAAELHARERLQRLKAKLDDNQPLLTGSTATGIGILDRAAHEGLANAGVESTLAFVNEVRQDCVEHAEAVNPLFGPNTLVATAPLQHLAFDEMLMARLPQLDVFHAGLPCSAASRAGRARTGAKNKHPEANQQVGHLVVPFLALIARTNPVAVVFENTEVYSSTASMDIMRNQLTDLGYVVHETVLDSRDYNMLEPRRRVCMVAVTKGIEFDVSMIRRPEPLVRRLGEIVDEIPLNDPSWGRMQYLKDKRVRDEAKGSNFKMNVVTAESTQMGVLNKGVNKRQSTGTYWRHPVDQDLLRIPTVKEHARVKGVWEDMVANVGPTFGHEVLGQSISVPPWIEVFRALGQALRAFAVSGNKPSCLVEICDAIAA